jgi:pyruvate/2-oxoglutarate dehydrogenase complex dihydrolipoamide dehydrogenase (E3) component
LSSSAPAPAATSLAIRAAQLGFTTACIEGWKNPKQQLKLGGTCLNVGCIPSKALLASSESYEHASTASTSTGISVGGVKLDLGKMQARKDAIVEKMTKGIEFLFKKNKITWLHGFGRLRLGRRGRLHARGHERRQERDRAGEACDRRDRVQGAPPARTCRWTTCCVATTKGALRLRLGAENAWVSSAPA